MILGLTKQDILALTNESKRKAVRSGWQESSTAISACRAFSHGASSG